MIWSALSGSKRGSSVTVAPTLTALFIVQVWPKEWNSGRAPRRTSSSLISPSFSDTPFEFLDRFEWVSSAPFGLPVVPDV
jgi:hypothetical protein